MLAPLKVYQSRVFGDFGGFDETCRRVRQATAYLPQNKQMLKEGKGYF